jgi:hypothetical protein
MEDKRTDKDKVSDAEEALRILNHPLVEKVFSEITEELIVRIFANDDKLNRDKIAYMKQGIDMFVLKLHGYKNEGDMVKKAK